MRYNKEYTTSVEHKEYPTNPLVPLDPAFINNIGTIQNLLNTPINGVAIITSKKGSVRSNHMHKEDFHYLYIISGSLEYFERSIDEDGSKITPTTYKAGDLIFTPPLKVHKTVFFEDCVMMSFSKRNRDHDSHEKDLVRVEF